MVSCPTEHELELLLSDQPAAASGDWNAHVLGCGSCQRWLSDARADEALLDPIRDALRRMPLPRANGSSSVGLESLHAGSPAPPVTHGIDIPGIKLGALIG